MTAGTVRALEEEYKREWKGLGNPLLEGELQKISEESFRRIGDIMQKFMHKTRAIPYISNYVVRRLLRRAR